MAVAADRNAHQQLFVLGMELTGLLMAEEQTADHLARPRNDRNGQITAHRQMPFRHPRTRRVLAVARIFLDIVRTDNARPQKCRFEHRSVARHRETRKRFTRCAGQRVKHVAFALLVDDIIEERTKLRADQFGAGIGHDLDDPVDVEFRGDRSAGLIEKLKLAGLGPDRVFRHARFGDVVSLNENAAGVTVGHDRLVDEVEIALVGLGAQAMPQINFRATPQKTARLICRPGRANR